MDVFAEGVHEHGRIGTGTFDGKEGLSHFIVVFIRTRAKAMRKSPGKKRHQALRHQNLKRLFNHLAKNFWRLGCIFRTTPGGPVTALDDVFFQSILFHWGEALCRNLHTKTVYARVHPLSIWGGLLIRKSGSANATRDG